MLVFRWTLKFDSRYS